METKQNFGNSCFAEPDSPAIPKISPSLIDKFMDLTAWFSRDYFYLKKPVRTGNDLVRFDIFIISSAMGLRVLNIYYFFTIEWWNAFH